MKKFILISAILCLLLCSCSSVEISENSGRARFVYGDTDIETDITNEDFEAINEIFNNKMLYFDSPSCGFTENISVIIGDKTFCIANDDCSIIYVKEENEYFNITDKENQTLSREVLSEPA